MREGLKADLEANFTDPQISIEQEVLRSFNSGPRQVFRKIDSRELFENFAEVKAAGIDCLCYLAQREIIRLMFLNA